jgi:hypothetical protein
VAFNREVPWLSACGHFEERRGADIATRHVAMVLLVISAGTACGLLLGRVFASKYRSQYLFGAGGRVSKGSIPSFSLARIRPTNRRLNW